LRTRVSDCRTLGIGTAAMGATAAPTELLLDGKAAPIKLN